MPIDEDDILKKMVSAAEAVLKKDWPDVKDYAEMEFKKIAVNISVIEQMKSGNNISEEQARLQLDIQKNSSRAVLLTLEGLGIVMAEKAINSAFSEVKDLVNRIIGWELF